MLEVSLDVMVCGSQSISFAIVMIKVKHIFEWCVCVCVCVMTEELNIAYRIDGNMGLQLLKATNCINYIN